MWVMSHLFSNKCPSDLLKKIKLKLMYRICKKIKMEWLVEVEDDGLRIHLCLDTGVLLVLMLGSHK